MVDVSKHMSNFELHTTPPSNLLYFWKRMILPSYYVKTRIVPKEGRRPHFLQTLSVSSVAVRNKRKNSQHGDSSGILTMVMWNEWDNFPASNLMMLSAFLVILKLAKA